MPGRFNRGSGKERIILLAIEDITERKEIEAGLEKTRKELEVIKKSADEALEYAESIINTVREPLISLDQDLRVVTASRSFYEVFKVNPEETVGQLIYDLGNKQWDIPKLRELLETILPQKATFDNYEVEHDFSTIGRRIMLLNARQIQRGSGKERIILLAIEDITEEPSCARICLALLKYWFWPSKNPGRPGLSRTVARAPVRWERRVTGWRGVSVRPLSPLLGTRAIRSRGATGLWSEWLA